MKIISFKALSKMVYWLLPLYFNGAEQVLEYKHIFYVDQKGKKVAMWDVSLRSLPHPLSHSKHSKPAVPVPTSSFPLPSSLPTIDSVAVLQLTIPSKLLHLLTKRCFFRVL